MWVGTSWKMNKDNASARASADVLAAVTDWRGVQPFVIPSFTAIETVAARLRDTRILVGGQNMHWDDEGAWTGEVSAPMLRSCGARLVELGHSERRTHFGETDETVNRKVHAALRHDLIPLVCVGETARERDWGVAGAVLDRQVRIALHGTRPSDAVRAIIAYEPVWAIGVAGRAAEPDVVSEALRVIRSTLSSVATRGDTVPILYGGSVSEDNAASYAALPGIDGLFIGRAAWEPEAFVRLAETVGALA